MAGISNRDQLKRKAALFRNCPEQRRLSRKEKAAAHIVRHSSRSVCAASHSVCQKSQLAIKAANSMRHRHPTEREGG